MSITEIEVATEELLNSLYTIELHRWVSLQYVQYVSLETLVQTLVWSSHWKFPLEAVERNEQLQAAVHLIRKLKFMSGELPIPLYISSETIKYEWLNCRLPQVSIWWEKLQSCWFTALGLFGTATNIGMERLDYINPEYNLIFHIILVSWTY